MIRDLDHAIAIARNAAVETAGYTRFRSLEDDRDLCIDLDELEDFLKEIRDKQLFKRKG